jgi:hypothetical protein
MQSIPKNFFLDYTCRTPTRQPKARDVSYFAVFLCGLASWRELTPFLEAISRQDAKAQSIAKGKSTTMPAVEPVQSERLTD